MIRYLYIVLFGLVVNSTHAQDTIFQKIYGSISSDFGRAVVQTYDHNYIMAGTSTSFSSNSNHIWFLKVDSFGNYMWQRNYGGINTEWVSDMVETRDSNILVCGYTNSYGNGGYEGYVMKLNKMGDTLWTRTYGGVKWDFFYEVLESYSGDYYFCGETYNTGGIQDVFVVKTKPNGDTVWTKKFGSDSIDVAYAFVQTYDSNFVLVGKTHLNGGEDVYVLKIDSLGNLLWSTSFSWSFSDIAYDIIQHTDSHLLITGGSHSTMGLGDRDMFTLRLTTNGLNPLLKFIGGPDEDQANTIVLSKNNRVYIGGYNKSFAAGKKDASYYHVDQYGNYQFGRILGFNEDETIYDSYPCYDGSVVFFGQTASRGYGLDDYYLIKTDTLGNTTSQFVVIIGVEDNNQQSINKLRVYPNPSNSLVNISSSELMIKEVNIFTISGKSVYSHQFSDKKGSIFTNEMESGIYFLNIVLENNQTKIIKLIVSH